MAGTPSTYHDQHSEGVKGGKERREERKEEGEGGEEREEEGEGEGEGGREAETFSKQLQQK